jgi:hypothetical protein
MFGHGMKSILSGCDDEITLEEQRSSQELAILDTPNFNLTDITNIMESHNPFDIFNVNKLGVTGFNFQIISDIIKCNHQASVLKHSLCQYLLIIAKDEEKRRLSILSQITGITGSDSNEFSRDDLLKLLSNEYGLKSILSKLDTNGEADNGIIRLDDNYCLVKTSLLDSIKSNSNTVKKMKKSKHEDTFKCEHVGRGHYAKVSSL